MLVGVVVTSEFELYGGVGEMTVMALLAFTMRQVRGGITMVGCSFMGMIPWKPVQ